MWPSSLALVAACLVSGGWGGATPNNFCADIDPQPHVIIDQLMGMWFGVEIINHLDERHHARREPTCPIIHISEDREMSTTFNPLYKSYNYGYNYGQGHGYGVTARPPSPVTQQELRRRMREQVEYDRQTTYGNYPASRRQQAYDSMGGRHGIEARFLRLLWDENGDTTEFRMRYNVSRAGFWISSGPESGGASLDAQYSHFAGTIQVLKAVGNHLVLTFCHQLPDRQLYSVILSRELSLHHVEVLGVHNMLNRRGLRTSAVQRACNGGAAGGVVASLMMVVVSAMWHFVWRRGSSV